MICFEPINDLLECWVVLEFESIPECPFSFSVFILRRRYGLRETEEW